MKGIAARVILADARQRKYASRLIGSTEESEVRFFMSTTTVEKQFYTPDELVAMGYASRSTVCRRIRAGEIPTIRDGRRYLIPVKDFEEFLDKKRDDRRREVAAL